MDIFDAIDQDDYTKIDELLTEIDIFKTRKRIKLDEGMYINDAYSILSYMIYLKKYEMFKKYAIIDPDCKLNVSLDIIDLNRKCDVDQALFALEYIKDINYGKGRYLCDAIHTYLKDKDYLIVVEKILNKGADLHIIDSLGFSAADLMISYHMDKLEPFKKYNIKYANISYLKFLIIEEYDYDEIEIIANHVKDINEVDKDGHTVLWYELNKHEPNSDVLELFEVLGAVCI